MRFHSRLLLVIACAVATGNGADLAFDVASIKPAPPDARGWSIRPLPGRLRAGNVTLKQLIGEAYHVFDFQISGGPKWVDSDRYDVEAKIEREPVPTHTEMRAMLRNLLEDRFALAVRHESRKMQVYALLTGQSGPKFQRAKDPGGQIVFRVFQRRQITAENARLQNLTETLSYLIGTPVVDRTGLEGTFDYRLEWTPDELQVRSTEAPPQADGDAPRLDGALQQQLGLKLVSQKDQVEVMVVEKADKPTSN